MPGTGLAFGRAVEAAFMLGAFLAGGPRMGRADAFLRAKADKVPDIMEAGWRALEGWPVGFHRALDGLRSASDTRGGRYGLRREFGGLAKWLASISGDAWAAPLREGFAGYLAMQADLRTSAAALRRFGSPEKLRNRHMTMNDAADFLGVAGETMMSLAEREKLYLVRPSGAGAPSLLRADRVHELRSRKAATLMKDEAEQLLGIGRKALRDLLEKGLLEQVDADVRVTHQRIVSRESIDTLIAGITARMGRTRQQVGLIPLSSTGRGRRTVGDVCRAVLDGRLRPRGRRPVGTGIGALLFSPPEVEAAFTVERGTMSLAEVAVKLEADIESVRIWASCGLLATEARAGWAERGQRVTEEGLDAFRAAYVTGAEIAKLASTTGRWAGERLAFLGHQCLAPEAMTRLYPRSILGGDLLEKLGVGVVRVDRATSAASSADLARRVGGAIGQDLGLPLKRYWNGFRDVDSGTYVQVIVGKRQRFRSKYVFRFNPTMRTNLEQAKTGWLALALADWGSYLIFSREEAREMMTSAGTHRHHIYVAVDAQGRTENLEDQARQRWLASPGLIP